MKTIFLSLSFLLLFSQVCRGTELIEFDAQQVTITRIVLTPFTKLPRDEIPDVGEPFHGSTGFAVSGIAMYNRVSDALCEPESVSTVNSNATDGVSAARLMWIAIAAPGKCSLFVKAKNARAAGAEGLLAIGFRRTPGLLYYDSEMRKNDDFSDLNLFPVVELSLNELENFDGHFVVLTRDQNWFVKVGESIWVVYSILFGSLNIIFFFAAASFLSPMRLSCERSQLICRCESSGAKKKLALSLLSIFLSILRIPVLVDPIGSRGIIPWTVLEAFFSIEYAITLVCVIYLGWICHELLEDLFRAFPVGVDSRIYMFSGFNMQCFMIFLCAFILIVEGTSSLLGSVWRVVGVMSTVKSVLYTIYSIGAGLYLTHFVRFLKSFENAQSMASRKYKFGLQQIHLLILILAFFAIANVIFVLSSVAENPLGYCASRFVLTLLAYLLNFSVLLPRKLTALRIGTDDNDLLRVKEESGFSDDEEMQDVVDRQSGDNLDDAAYRLDRVD